MNIINFSLQPRRLTNYSITEYKLNSFDDVLCWWATQDPGTGWTPKCLTYESIKSIDKFQCYLWKSINEFVLGIIYSGGSL